MIELPESRRAVTSCAQDGLWFLDALLPGSPANTIHRAYSVTGTLDVNALHAAWRAVVRRHEALRTTLIESDGRPVQLISEDDGGSFVRMQPRMRPQPWPRLDPESDADALCAELAAAPFDLASGPLARLTVVPLGAAEHRVVLVLHRAVADERSMSILVDELSAFYAFYAAAVNGGTVRVGLPAPAAQYADYARWQRDRLGTPEFRRLLQWWTSALSPLPPAPTLPVDRARPVGPSPTGVHSVGPSPAGARAVGPSPGGGAVRFDCAVRFDWGAGSGRGVAELANAEGSTPFAVLLTAFQCLLFRYGGYGGEDRVAVGVPVAVRPRPEFAGLVGPCTNLLVLCADVSGRPTFRELLARVTRLVRDALEHRELPFVELVRALNVDRDPRRIPLCDAMFVCAEDADEAEPELTLAGTAVRRWHVDSGTARTDLTLTVDAVTPAVAGSLEYRAGLFERSSARRVLDQLHTLLVAALAEPDVPVDLLPLEDRATMHTGGQLAACGPGELAARGPDQLGASGPGELAACGPGQLAASKRARAAGGQLAGPERPVHELVSEHAGRRPAADAIAWDGDAVSYRELDERATSIARSLRALGIADGSAAVVRMPPGPRQIAALLGVLRAGAHLVWFGTGDAGERGKAVLDDLRPACLVLDGEPAGDELAQWYGAEMDGLVVDIAALDGRDPTLPPVRAQCAIAPIERAQCDIPLKAARGGLGGNGGGVGLDERAYVAYTSGSTGRPKGIAQSHGAFAQFVTWMAGEFGIGPGSRVAQWVAPEHDPALCEVFATLASGATLCPIPERIRRNPEKLVDWLAAERITVIQTVPSFARELLKVIVKRAPITVALDHLLLMGEALPGDLVNGLRAALPSTRLVNLYGPTETIAATWHEITGVVHGTVPIGRTIPGRLVLLLDELDRPCPAGVTGEIVVRSRYVTPGYLGGGTAGVAAFRPLPDLAEFGIENDETCHAGHPQPSRAYRTGDLGRWRWDGTLEFRGRKDFQIKLLGNRLELTEIEAALAEHESVRECAVVALTDSDGLATRLVVYVVPHGAAAVDVWRAHLRQRFGRAMLPALFTTVSGRLPRNVGGKVDRRRLPDPGLFLAQNARAPQSAMEKGMAAIWSELLGVERLTAEDTLFTAGGHSLLVSQLIHRIRGHFGVEMSPWEYFANPTLAGLAALVESLDRSPRTADTGNHDGVRNVTLVQTSASVDFDGESLDIAGLRRVAEDRVPCTVTAAALNRAAKSRAMFEDIVRQEIPIYGVTTGYGEMIYMLVATSKEVELQTNLVRSHSAGVGPLFAEDEARAIVAARLNALAKGYSAVRPEVLQRLALYLNLGITPAIPEMGSLGASGDLAPLAHVASTVIGEGYLLRDGKRVETGQVLREYGIEPLQLRFKEGLALINGTSGMTGLGSLVTHRALNQVRQAEIVTALVIEALQGSTSPFLPEGHDVARPHRGQIDTAANIRALMRGSEATVEHAKLRRLVAEGAENGHRNGGRNGDVKRTEIYLQKAYSLRAIPQVVGAVRDTLYHAVDKLNIELNSANDNPLFFEGQEIFHGANFHGQPIAFVMDFVTIALTQLGVLSERRTNRLLNRHLSYGLPEFLVAGDPGLNSGFAGAQYPATALVAENRTIGPASTQSVPSNGDNQDVVSMGLISARNARRVLQNNDKILAVEFLAAAQAVDLSGRYDRLSPAAKATYDAVRSLVPTLDHDRFMADDIEVVADALSRGTFLDAAGTELS